MKYTDQLLVEQLRRGNEEAYKHLYDHHYAVLCHFAKQYVGDKFTAETIVGDVIFHVWEIRESLNIQYSIRSYLMKAVRNRCFDYLDSQHLRHEISLSNPDVEHTLNNLLTEPDHYPLNILLERELENEIKNALAKLPKECRIVFEKKRFEDKKYEEIAAELGISVNTVKYHIKNALHILRAELDQFLVVVLVFFIS